MNKARQVTADTDTELRIILISAGATELDAQGRITGNLDVPMCSEAEENVRRAAAQLSFSQIDMIYASTCDAARHSAKLLSTDRRLKIRVSPTLTNLDCGLWHGKRIEEVKQTQPKLFRKWAEMSEDFCPPDGETFTSARDRVSQFLAQVKKKHSGGTIAVVAPQPLLSVIRTLLDSSADPQPWTTVAESGKWEEYTLTEAQLCGLAPASAIAD